MSKINREIALVTSLNIIWGHVKIEIDINEGSRKKKQIFYVQADRQVGGGGRPG